MQGMTNSLRELIPYMYNERLYSHPRNKPFIQARLAELNHHSRGLDRHVGRGLSGDDPLMRVGLRRLKSSVQKSRDSFLVDNTDYSQQLLQTTVNYCVKCHLRTDSGRSFIVYDNFGNSSGQSLSPLSLARAQMAMRELGEARKNLLTVIDNSEEDKDVRLEALNMLMMLNVRRQENFERAQSDLKVALSVEKTFINADLLEKWQKYMTQWGGKKPLLALEVKAALEQLKKESPHPAHFVRDLHISRVLHHSLPTISNKELRAEILSRLGKIYQVHSSLSAWDLPENYYEACLEEFPHSPQAKSCYFSMERLLIQQYNVTDRNDLPRSERQRLTRLKAKSLPSRLKPTPDTIEPTL